MLQQAILRPWRMSDVGNIVRYSNNRAIADNLRDGFPQPYSQKDAQAFLKVCMAADPRRNLYLAVEVDGEAVGSIGLFQKDNVYRKSAELGYWLAQPYWGRGIITRAIGEACKTGFEQMDIVRIFAEPYAYNAASRRALEKAGFVLEGVLRQSVYKNGELWDSCIYALLKDEWQCS